MSKNSSKQTENKNQPPAGPNPAPLNHAKRPFRKGLKMLYRLPPHQYPQLAEMACRHDCGAVYPLSVAEGNQGGDVFADSPTVPEAFLLWANCGFAYLCGKVDDGFLAEVYLLMQDSHRNGSKRFLLMTKSQPVLDFFAQKGTTTAELRYLFDYTGSADFVPPSLPDGYDLKAIDRELYTKISGQVTPSLFWNDADSFVRYGTGCCITCGDDAASWAFSAGVGGEYVDIGIQTGDAHKQRGLGLIAADMAIKDVLAQGKKPVWACHHLNTASAKMAEKLGFVRSDECMVVKIKG